MKDRIEFQCKRCETAYRLRAEWAGRRTRCKKCGQTFRVPKAQTSFDDMVVKWLGQVDPLAQENDDAKARLPKTRIPPKPKPIRAIQGDGELTKRPTPAG